MATRTLQEHECGSILMVIPKYFVEAAGLVPGEKVKVGFEDSKITISKLLFVTTSVGLVYIGLAVFRLVSGLAYINIFIA